MHPVHGMCEGLPEKSALNPRGAERENRLMERVLVIGCPGSGKSTFARRLRDLTGLPLYYLDRLWHRPDGTHVPESVFDAQLETMLREDAWIIDGNYLRTLEVRLPLSFRRCRADASDSGEPAPGCASSPGAPAAYRSACACSGSASVSFSQSRSGSEDWRS